jgi:hypothetical protein
VTTTYPFVLAEDSALKAHLSGITVSDDKSSNRPVKIWYGFPDVEIRDQLFPYITIDLIDIMPANERQTYGFITDTDNLGTVTPDANYAYTNQIPVAYDIIYQITSFSRHPRHDRSIIYQLMTKFPSKYSRLKVFTPDGTGFTIRSMFVDGFVKRDTVEGETGNRRLLRNVYTVRVVSQMTPDVANAVATKLVSTVRINNTTSSIPSGLKPVRPSVTHS